jgi:hypothetical protein
MKDSVSFGVTYVKILFWALPPFGDSILYPSWEVIVPTRKWVFFIPIYKDGSETGTRVFGLT